MPFKTDNRHGFGMIGIFVAILAVGLLMVAITRLLMSMSQGIGNLNERLEMQSIIQDQWKQMNAGTYEDFEDIVAAKGSPWTQSFGAKYEMKVEFGGKGKYVDAACDSSGSVAETDRQCRKVTISIVSKALPDVMESLRMTRVSEPDEKELLKRIEERIAENGNKFNTLYTKAESDARYIRYGMGDFACPWDFKKAASGVGCEACAAPANDMQYRSGNCQLSTCPSGQMANADQNGCVARVCPHATMLNAAGTACEACTGIPEGSEWKQYYGANCSVQTCPVGQEVNETGDGCKDIVCPAGFELIGDECKCPSNQILDEASDSCKTCSSGQQPNADQTACEDIPIQPGCVSYRETKAQGMNSTTLQPPCSGVNCANWKYTQLVWGGILFPENVLSSYGGGTSIDNAYIILNVPATVYWPNFSYNDETLPAVTQTYPAGSTIKIVNGMIEYRGTPSPNSGKTTMHKRRTASSICWGS